MFYAWIDDELLNSERKFACVARSLRRHPALPSTSSPQGPTRQPTLRVVPVPFRLAGTGVSYSRILVAKVLPDHLLSVPVVVVITRYARIVSS